MSADVLSQLFGGATPGAGAAAFPDTTPDDPAVEQDVLSHVRNAIKELQAGADKEPDAVEKADLVDTIAKLHKWLANDQKSAEAALGGGPATRALRKASSGY